MSGVALSASPTSGLGPVNHRSCLISLATRHLGFPVALERLAESARRQGYDGDLCFWRPGSFPDGCPPHYEVPFAFKPFCLQNARRQGYDLALWLDSACVVVRTLAPLFDEIARNGYLLFRNGDYRLGEWAGDAALSHFGLHREAALGLPEVNATVIGLNLQSRIGHDFLEAWHAAALAVVPFRGTRKPLASEDDYQAVKWNLKGRVSADPRVRGHRHDQTVAGILASRFGMALRSNGLQPYSRERPRILWETRIVIDRDVKKPGTVVTPIAKVYQNKYLGFFLARL